MYNYNPRSPFSIDPSKEYPISFQSYMSPDGYWDMYGPNPHWYEEDTFLTEDQVREIVLAKKFKESK
jgi:hypothetical protein